MHRAHTLALWSFIAIIVIFVLEVIIGQLGTGALGIAMTLAFPAMIASFLIPIAIVTSLVILFSTPRDPNMESIRKKALRYNSFSVVIYIIPIIFLLLQISIGISFYPVSAYFEPFNLLSLVRPFLL